MHPQSKAWDSYTSSEIIQPPDGPKASIPHHLLSTQDTPGTGLYHCEQNDTQRLPSWHLQTNAGEKLNRSIYNYKLRGFLRGPVVKNPPCNARETGSIPGLGRSYMPAALGPRHHDSRSLHTLESTTREAPAGRSLSTTPRE